MIIKKDNVVIKEHNLTYDGRKNTFTGFPLEVKLYFALAEAKGEVKLFDDHIGSFWGTQNIRTYNVFPSGTSVNLYGSAEYQLNMPRKLVYEVAWHMRDMQYYYE